VKKLHIALVFGFLAIICLSSGLAAANISQDELTTQTTWSKSALPQGNGVVVTITVQSHSDKQLQVYYFGVHFDWMGEDGFWGQNLQSSPVTIPSGGSYTFSPSIINIPEDASLGSHTYKIGIDGEDSSGNAFSWTSSDATIQVVPYSASTSPSSSNSDGTQNSDNSADWTLGIVVIAVTAVAMIVIILIVLRRKRSPTPAPSSAPTTEEPQPPTPPQDSPAPEQEFNI
jgi:hypothetical protein